MAAKKITANEIPVIYQIEFSSSSVGFVSEVESRPVDDCSD